MKAFFAGLLLIALFILASLFRAQISDAAKGLLITGTLLGFQALLFVGTFRKHR